MTVTDFPVKERLRFRKLLEVAQSTSYSGEREAALSAATRLAESFGMTLREAAGMKESPQPRQAAAKPRRARGFPADFGAAGPDVMGAWWVPRSAAAQAARHLDDDSLAADKKRREEALADAIRRGLDAEERAKEDQKNAASTRARTRAHMRRAWRPRTEFIRVLLMETRMPAKEIAAVAGVTIYDVFREKLLLRRSQAAS